MNHRRDLWDFRTRVYHHLQADRIAVGLLLGLWGSWTFDKESPRCHVTRAAHQELAVIWPTEPWSRTAQQQFVIKWSGIYAIRPSRSEGSSKSHEEFAQMPRVFTLDNNASAAKHVPIASLKHSLELVERKRRPGSSLLIIAHRAGTTQKWTAAALQLLCGTILNDTGKRKCLHWTEFWAILHMVLEFGRRNGQMCDDCSLIRGL